MTGLPDIGFLRPAWLATLLLLPWLALAWRRRAVRRSGWRTAVDPHLLPHLLDDGRGGGRHRVAGPAALAGLAVAIIALAGPSWRSVPQPLLGGGGALVIALELSDATLAADLPPSRLVQARARLAALLDAHAGEVGLVVYADDAHVVAPVTPDPGNVSVFLDALAPDVMPVDGRRPGRAIELGMQLLEQAGQASGTILLLAPAADGDAERAARRAAAAGHRVSVIAMGAPGGAGYRARDGSIRRSGLDAASLQKVAEAGGGAVHGWDTSPGDVLAAIDASGATEAGRAAGPAAAVREDGGYWLLPLALLLVLPAFRRGAVFAVLLACVALPPSPAMAAQDHPAATGSAWRRADQVLHARSLEAEAAYRRGDFAAAARGFAELPGADAAYNRGNALARAGRYEEAIAAYDEALRQSPGMPDASANRAAVLAAMQRDPPQGGGRQGDASPRPGDGDRGSGGDPGQRGDDGSAAPDADPGRGPDGARQDPAPATERPPGAGETTPPPAAADAADAAARQAEADAAQREAMQRALEAGPDAGPGVDEASQGDGPARSLADRERDEANAAWLRRVPDDPGALLRARFRNEHLRRRAGGR